MTILEAYTHLFQLSSGNQWHSIPEDIRRILSLPHNMGIMGGILCTKSSAIGINQLISKLNRIGDKSL